MAFVNVRRINEWDSPAILKIYEPYIINTLASFEESAPTLSELVNLVDRYTYGLGWLSCEIDFTPAGFCFLTENRDDPENPFACDLQVFVKDEFKRKRVATALVSLITDIMEYGNRRSVTARVLLPNAAATSFFKSMGFSAVRVIPEGHIKFGKSHDILILTKNLNPQDLTAERPTKPYLIENSDYEAARERAAAMVDM